MHKNTSDSNLWKNLKSLTKTVTHTKHLEYFRQGIALYNRKHYKHAIEKFLQALDHDPTHLETHHSLALAYTCQKNFNQALAHLYEITRATHPYAKATTVYLLLAYIYGLQGDYENTKEALMKVLEEDPHNSIALSIAGYIEYSQRHYDQAEQYYKQVLALGHNNAHAYNSLAMIYIDSEKNIHKGIEYCNKALKLKANNPAYLDSLGWAYYKLKDHNKAITYLRHAHELDSNNPNIKEHLKKVLDI